MSLHKRTKRLPVKLTLDPAVRTQAERLPEVIDRSLSALVERLLRNEIERHRAPAKSKT
jgi:hypothetical protein